MKFKLVDLSARVRERTGVAFGSGFLRTRSTRWWAAVVAVGVGGGLIGAAYVELMTLVGDVLGPGHFTDAERLLVLVGVGAVIGALVVWLGATGDVELLVDNIHVGRRRADVRELRSLVPVSLLGIGAGSAIGPEAPLVQTTGTAAGFLATRLGMEVDDARVLTICGMAAGFTVLFGAPLGATLFALEILHRRGLEYYEALIPASVAALAGWVAYVGTRAIGFAPVWHFPSVHSTDFGDLLLGVAAGVVAAAIAAGFAWWSRVSRAGFRRLPAWSRPALGGLALGALAFASPYALTFGEGQIQQVAITRIAVGTLLLGALVKFVAAGAIASSGWRGGFIIPLFFIGAALGAAAWDAFGVHRVVIMVALMVALNVGVTKTPFGSTLVVVEMAGLPVLAPALVAALASLFLTSQVGLIESQRSRERAVRDRPDESPPVV
jgi:H+/Cl- antiporter ClcA